MKCLLSIILNRYFSYLKTSKDFLLDFNYIPGCLYPLMTVHIMMQEKKYALKKLLPTNFVVYLSLYKLTRIPTD